MTKNFIYLRLLAGCLLYSLSACQQAPISPILAPTLAPISLAPSAEPAADTIEVPCDSVSLMTAIQYANTQAPKPITLKLTAGCTYSLSSPLAEHTALPIITGDIHLEANQAVIELTNQSEPLRVFYIARGGSLAINQLTIMGYSVFIPGEPLEGGAIFNLGNLTVQESHFEQLSGLLGGVLYNAGNLEVLESSFYGNVAKEQGGAIYSNGVMHIEAVDFSHNGVEVDGVGGGAVSIHDGEVTIKNCSFKSNYFPGDWMGGGALLNRFGDLTIEGTLFKSNVSDWGGAVRIKGAVVIKESQFINNMGGHGAALVLDDGQYTVIDSTFYYNQGSFAPAIRLTGTANLGLRNSLINRNLGGVNQAIVIGPQSELRMENSTITGNFRGEGSSVILVEGTLWLSYVSIVENAEAIGLLLMPGGSLGSTNSIVANNAQDCSLQGAVQLHGQNLDSDGTCIGFNLTADPGLAPLAENGGPTQSMALLANSPALDAATGTCLLYDQRYAARPAGSACDLGAFETQDIFSQLGDIELAIPAELLKDSLCLQGPGEVYDIVQSFFSGTQVRAVGQRLGWAVVESLAYEGELCWLPETALHLDTPLTELPLFSLPLTPTPTLQPESSEEMGCWIIVSPSLGRQCRYPCPAGSDNEGPCTP